MTYEITTGNEDGKFDIDTNGGEITVAGALDYETSLSYSLTVEGSDASGNTASVTVDIAVTDVFDAGASRSQPWMGWGRRPIGCRAGKTAASYDAP